VFWHKSSGQRHVDGFRSDGSNMSIRLYLQKNVLYNGASCTHCRRVAVGALRRSGGAGLLRQQLLGLSGHAAGAGGGLPPGSGGRHADAAPRPVQVTTRLPATAGKPQRDACRHNALVLRRSGRHRRNAARRLAATATAAVAAVLPLRLDQCSSRSEKAARGKGTCGGVPSIQHAARRGGSSSYVASMLHITVHLRRQNVSSSARIRQKIDRR